MLGNKNVKCKLISPHLSRLQLGVHFFTSENTRSAWGEEERAGKKRRMKELCNEEARRLDAKEKGG